MDNLLVEIRGICSFDDISCISIETTDGHKLLIHRFSEEVMISLSQIEYDQLNEEFDELNIFMKDGSWFELEQFEMNDEWYTHLVHRVEPIWCDENIDLRDFVMLKKPEPVEVV